MKVSLFYGVTFKATLRPNSIQWSWGRDNFKTVSNSCVKNEVTKEIINNVAQRLSSVMRDSDFRVDKEAQIKQIKKGFLEAMKKHRLEE